jgi:two-component system, NtrC family, response regulator
MINRAPWGFVGGDARFPASVPVMASLELAATREPAASDADPMDGVLGNSPAIVKVCRAIERVAPADVSVVLTGESGTGKEVMARALHVASPRARQRFVAINCAAIPETLLESELFGYERGAFTGAIKQTLGKIEHAHRGTLFLDEIGDLPLSLQAKLLRFLQERVVERLGGRKEIEVDVRVICATHRDLRKLLEEGSFREDLYYRLAEISVHIPPLRDRVGDAVLMARHFLRSTAPRRTGRSRGSPPRRWARSTPTPGRATSVSCRIASSAR